jgi:hypothetical protein
MTEYKEYNAFSHLSSSVSAIRSCIGKLKFLWELFLYDLSLTENQIPNTEYLLPAGHNVQVI